MVPIANTIGEHYIQIGEVRGEARGILGQLRLLEAFLGEDIRDEVRAQYEEKARVLRQQLEDLEKLATS